MRPRTSCSDARWLPRFPYAVIFMDLVTEDGILAVARLLARSRRVRRLSASRVGTRSEVPRFRARRAALGHTRDEGRLGSRDPSRAQPNVALSTTWPRSSYSGRIINNSGRR